MITVELNGQKWPYHFNMMSVQWWCTLQGKKMSDFHLMMKGTITQDVTPLEISDIHYGGLAEGYRKKYGISNPPFSREDVAEWISEAEEDTLVAMWEEVFKSVKPAPATPLMDAEPKVKKKRSPSKKRSTKQSSSADSVQKNSTS
jgi:acetyl-CoA acetyltransferase